MMMTHTFKLWFVVMALSCCMTPCRGKIILEHLSTVYVPNGYNPITYGYNVEAAEQCAVDTQSPYVYAAGANIIHVVNFTEPTFARLESYAEISPNPEEGGINDIETCGDWVAVAYNSFIRPLEGRAIVFSRYDGNPGSMERLHDVIVGATPDSLKFTSDCSKVLVAIEGELVNNNGTMVDPEGGVTVVEFEGGQPGGGEPTVTFVDFTAYNDVSDDYISRGVRKVYNGQNTEDIDSTTFSQDLEPENLALNSDNTLAYVPLQENNAIAVLDIAALQFLEIYPMGYRDYSVGNEDRMDPSDQDGVARIQNWGDGMSGVFGMYQSDGIEFLSFEGTEYVITANEGDTKEYEDMGLDENWSEAMRGRHILEAGLVSSNVSAEFVELLADDALLGRLYFSLVDGSDDEGLIERFLAFGGRCFAVHRVSDFSLAWDSRDDIEQRINDSFPQVFNGNARNEDDTPEESFDSRSDNRGPEPESLDSGVVNGKTVVFVGVERPGMLAVYTVVPDTDLQLQFESIYYYGGLGESYYKLWAERTARDLEPEDVRFVPVDKSPSGNDMLIVAGAVSGTISFYDVIDTETRSD